MIKKNNNNLTIGEAADFLGVSIDTLRRWDKSGKLKAQKSVGGHRYYPKEQLERFVADIFAVARIWAESSTSSEIPDEQYCQTYDIFTGRLGRMASALEQNSDIEDIIPLIIAVVGEIGNNSFDHNFGNWPDVPGIFFDYNMDKRIIVLADRGQGIRATLLRVRPEIKNDIEALTIAFTERVSGRSPEQRGNGLKFVREVATENPMGVALQSGTAVAEIAKNNGQLKINLAQRNLVGTLTKIEY
ncbi:MAG: helix-turn-helix domain-containing protein [Candidatus Spechtbacterales bacterium]